MACGSFRPCSPGTLRHLIRKYCALLGVIYYSYLSITLAESQLKPKRNLLFGKRSVITTPGKISNLVRTLPELLRSSAGLLRTLYHAGIGQIVRFFRECRIPPSFISEEPFEASFKLHKVCALDVPLSSSVLTQLFCDTENLDRGWLSN